MKYLILTLFLVSCSYKQPLKNHSLIVPEIIQNDYPEIHKVFIKEEK